MLISPFLSEYDLAFGICICVIMYLYMYNMYVYMYIHILCVACIGAYMHTCDVIFLSAGYRHVY